MSHLKHPNCTVLEPRVSEDNHAHVDLWYNKLPLSSWIQVAQVVEQAAHCFQGWRFNLELPLATGQIYIECTYMLNLSLFEISLTLLYPHIHSHLQQFLVASLEHLWVMFFGDGWWVFYPLVHTQQLFGVIGGWSLFRLSKGERQGTLWAG